MRVPYHVSLRVGEDIKFVGGDGAKDTLGDVHRGYPGLHCVVGRIPHGFLFRTQWHHRPASAPTMARAVENLRVDPSRAEAETLMFAPRCAS